MIAYKKLASYVALYEMIPGVWFFFTGYDTSLGLFDMALCCEREKTLWNSYLFVYRHLIHICLSPVIGFDKHDNERYLSYFLV